MGLRPGVPDLTFEAFRFVGHIELKAPRGKLSPEQVEFRAACQLYSIPFVVCYEVIEVHDQLVQWGFIRPGRFEFIRKPDLVKGVTA